MLSAIGFKTGAKVVSPDKANWHIYAVIGVNTFGNPTEIIPCDTTQPQSIPGWEPEMVHRKYQYLAWFTEGRASYRKVK
jgi:hypothetical protein